MAKISKETAAAKVGEVFDNPDVAILLVIGRNTVTGELIAPIFDTAPAQIVSILKQLILGLETQGGVGALQMSDPVTEIDDPGLMARMKGKPN